MKGSACRDKGGDPSRGWEAIAVRFIAARSHSHIGAEVVHNWAAQLKPQSTVVDIGCGSGEPVSDVLVREGHRVSGIDASPTLAAAYRERFPGSAVACEAAEESDMFGLQFDAAVAIGLIFLLPPQSQERVIAQVGKRLKPGGRFLFSAPWQRCEWNDLLTGENSVSLGRAAYRQALEAAGMHLHEYFTDEGENHYFSAIRDDVVEAAP